MVWDVDDAAWVRGLSDVAIVEATDPGSFERGVDYAESGMVQQVATLNRGRVLVARVSGSGREAYQTIVSLRGDPADAVVEWGARCSCPVAHDCKHAVAVVLSVRDALGGIQQVEPSRPWEDALASLTTEPPPESLDQGSPVALVVERVQSPVHTWGRERAPRVRVRPTRRTKAGHWAKKYSWSELLQPNSFTAAAVREDHRSALTSLFTLHEARTGARRYSYGSGGDVHLDVLGPDVWTALRRVRDAGVALIASEAGDEVEMLDEAVEVVLDVTAVHEGLLLRPSIDGAGPDAGDLQLVGEPAHGVVWTEAGDDGERVRLARFSADLTPELGELVAGRDIVVPEADVERFVALFLPRLRERVTVISSDDSVDLPQPEPPQLYVHVRRDGHGVLLDLGFAYTAGGHTHVVGADEQGSLPRDRRAERALLEGLEALADLPGARIRSQHGWRLRSPMRLHGPAAVLALTEVVPRLDDDPRCIVVVDDDVSSFEELDAEPDVSLHPASDDGGSDWLDLHVRVTVGDVEVPFEPLFAALVAGDEIMQLETGEWFRLGHPVLDDLRALIEEARALVEPEAGEVRLSRYQVDLFDELAAIADVEVEHAWRSGVETLREIDSRPVPEAPASLQATLRPYQLEGYHWLSTLWDAGLGGVLADDMGLGKTVQTLALLARAHEAGELDRPVLVVAPTSVVGTWASEAAKFVPDLVVRTLPHTHRRRGESVAEAVDGAHLVVTSYAVLRIDAAEFAEVGWRGVILDEAQFVKNDRSKTHQALRRLSAPFVLAVTGTPLENSLMDLWSLFALAAPGLYPRRDRFGDLYRKPIESGEQPELLDRLRRRIRPLMLRRTKEEVAIDLPPKQIQVLPVELSSTHRRIYDRHLQRERKRVLGLLDDPDANRVAILASLTRLRQLSLDPGLVDGERRGQGISAKLDVLVEHLGELAVEGHRALVFSQFTGFLAIVRERLEGEGITTSYLDGATTDRASVIDAFKQGEQTAFLISLKAGGVGLTLTEADYVFVLDPWWNPAAEAQAIDRAHRIGQDKPVMVYRLVSTGTIEDKVVELQERKRDLFQRVVDDGGELSGAITAADIRALLEPDG
ncbi:SNF2-related protein [Janibacter sp. RAF52]|uniref:DEAD/DEAH box helicase n=1 Tax=unclassified Janibacter TaxID=2649294 RepID=UPI003F91ADC4